jgi:DNA excision repair protein ERCC-4
MQKFKCWIWTFRRRNAKHALFTSLPHSSPLASQCCISNRNSIVVVISICSIITMDHTMIKSKKKKKNSEDEKTDLDDELPPGPDEPEPQSNKPPPLVPVGMMPQYLAEAFGQVYEEDGLVVLGKGLGCLLLIASFVRFYADTEEGHVAVCLMEREDASGNTVATTRRKPCKPPLVLVFGLKETERQALITILQSWGTPPELLPRMITSDESGQHASDRATLYQQGGVFCITSRILIVDLLTNVARAQDIDGILVAHADQVTETSTEAFILRIFQSQKQQQHATTTTGATTTTAAGSATTSRGFVKAFTDAPDRLLSGFAKVDKVMKALHVRRLYLYPRFHEIIRDELEEHPPTVTELHQSLSPMQQEMQAAIAAAVQACIRELKSTTKGASLEWTDAELSVENCVTAHFDKAISRQLEHEWFKLRPSTKQLVQDLRMLRTLFQSLLHYDCVLFLKLINSIKTMSAASRHPSMWLLTPAADLLFRKGKM